MSERLEITPRKDFVEEMRKIVGGSIATGTQLKHLGKIIFSHDVEISEKFPENGAKKQGGKHATFIVNVNDALSKHEYDEFFAATAKSAPFARVAVIERDSLPATEVFENGKRVTKKPVPA